METVSDILDAKGTRVEGVPRTATVFEAIQLMTRYDVGALIVTEEDQICGIITERDYLRRAAVLGRASKTTTVGEVMSPNLVCVTPTNSLAHCMEVMTDRRIRHLPVLSGERLVGIVSIGDIVKAMIREQASHIQHLTHYIQGRA